MRRPENRKTNEWEGKRDEGRIKRTRIEKEGKG